MKITEKKLRKIVRKQLQIKKLDELSKSIVTESEGAPGEEYKQKHGVKMPTNRTEAGTYMMNATRGSSGITSVEIPALIKMFDDMLNTFVQQNVTQSKSKHLEKGTMVGKQRAGIKDE